MLEHFHSFYLIKILLIIKRHALYNTTLVSKTKLSCRLLNVIDTEEGDENKKVQHLTHCACDIKKICLNL